MHFFPSILTKQREEKVPPEGYFLLISRPRVLKTDFWSDLATFQSMNYCINWALRQTLVHFIRQIKYWDVSWSIVVWDHGDRMIIKYYIIPKWVINSPDLPRPQNFCLKSAQSPAYRDKLKSLVRTWTWANYGICNYLLRFLYQHPAEGHKRLE